MDLRFLKQPKAKVAGETSSARVISFLESIYHSIAETLPDIRDASLITQLQFQDGQEVHEVLQDEYSQSLSPEGRKELSAKLALTAGPAKGCRKRKFGLNLHLERRPGHAASTNEVRFLPPGVMKDYFEMMKAQDQCQGVSFSLFWRTWLIEFPHLVFRPTSMHSQCSTCIHHKILIRELAGHVAARQRQNDLYAEHLKAQYRDRQAYWSARGISRLQMATNLVVIIDGMDQSKCLYPRSGVLSAKELAGLQRPKLHITGLIAHGFALILAVANHDHPKDASLMVELLAHLLTRLKRSGINLKSLNLHIQADNTTRELKNSTCLRFLSSLVSAGVIAGGTLQHLRSGHSHEDIDQCFGSLALFIVRHSRHCETPSQFVNVIDKFAQSAHRPFEKERIVLKVDQHRDWKLACRFLFVKFLAVPQDGKFLVCLGFQTDPTKSQREAFYILFQDLEPQRNRKFCIEGY